MVNIDLSGKIAVITGGGGVIPQGVAKCLGAAGAKIYVVDIKEEAAQAAIATLHELGIDADYLIADITDSSRVDEIFEEINAKEGRVDILVNCAGIMISKPYMELTSKDFNLQLSINLVGMDNCCRAALRYMREKKFGRIVNISSVAGRSGAPTAVHYSASKFGVIGLTQGIAASVVKDGITVNTICPGSVMSPLMQEVGAGYARTFGVSVEEGIRMHIAKSPTGQAQTPEDMGNAVLFFCSDLSTHITGCSLNVCGGKRMD